MFSNLIPTVMNALVGSAYLKSTDVDMTKACIFTIPYFEKTYYLLYNPNKIQLLVHFGEDKSAQTKAKYSVVSIPINKVDRVHKRTVLTGTCTSLDNLVEDALLKADYYEHFPIETRSSDFFNKFFDEELLVPEKEVNKFLFRIPIDEYMKSVLFNNYDRVETIETKYRNVFSVGNSIIKGDYIYTNNPFKVKENLHNFKNKLPTQEMRDFAEFKSHFLSTLTRVGKIDFKIEQQAKMKELLDAFEEKFLGDKNV